MALLKDYASLPLPQLTKIVELILRDWSVLVWWEVTIFTDEEKIFFDDMKKPHMSVVDKTFGKGRIGLGSFDDMNDFDDIKLVELK